MPSPARSTSALQDHTPSIRLGAQPDLDLDLTRRSHFPTPNSKQLDERFDALEARLGLGEGSTFVGAAAPAGPPLGTAPVTAGASAKTPGGTAAGRPAASLAEPGSGVRSCSGGAHRAGTPLPPRTPAHPLGEAAVSSSPGQGQGQGEGESSILHIRLPSPTKLASKHFRQSPEAKQRFGPYDA